MKTRPSKPCRYGMMRLTPIGTTSTNVRKMSLMRLKNSDRHLLLRPCRRKNTNNTVRCIANGTIIECYNPIASKSRLGCHHCQTFFFSAPDGSFPSAMLRSSCASTHFMQSFTLWGQSTLFIIKSRKHTEGRTFRSSLHMMILLMEFAVTTQLFRE